ncbi:MAG TPA: HAMP domain-containing sensor histidine kinase [Methylomirabilota bacterium]|nr:HAMP domain-containing sensor histidine kinase [Methylomirabilota bacterium]
MPEGHSRNAPVFWWRGLLILLPVVILAALGVLALRQDRRLTQNEAEQNARATTARLGSLLTEHLTRVENPRPPDAFRVDGSGRLVFPPPFEPVPVPFPLMASALNNDQQRVWNELQSMIPETASDEDGRVELALRQFAGLQPPAPFVASAHFNLAAQWAAAGKTTAALEHLSRVIAEFPDARGESGLPLEPMARLRRAELLAGDAREPGGFLAEVEALCSNAVLRPSAVSAQILDRAETLPGEHNPAREVVKSWRRQWEEHEIARRLYERARPELMASLTHAPLEAATPEGTEAIPGPVAPLLLYFGESPAWMAVRSDAGDGTAWFHCRPAGEWAETISDWIAGESWFPDYAMARVTLAGREVAVFPPVDAGSVANPEPLAVHILREPGGEWGRVNLELARPDLLFAAQNTRSFWFGAVILAATGAAVAGLLASHRAFRRQLRLSELKTNFVSSVSHELRAPLASVRLMAEGLDGGRVTEPGKQREYFRFIVQECRRLSSLIENVLDFARIEQGRKQYEFEPTDVPRWIRETLQLMEPAGSEQGVRLAADLETGDANSDAGCLVPVLDGRAMQQALINLIDNAIKHSSPGDVVTVGCRIVSARSPGSDNPDPAGANGEPGTLRLWVEDQGEGIPVGEQERIFERFHRVGPELRRRTRGVGIGLSIVKHVVEAHGGRITVRSAPGQGSRFTIEIPAKGSVLGIDH